MFHQSKITKAIIPVAGLGTRWLPMSKEIPKEMLPIVDRPIIQLIVEEAVQAGIKEIILITSRSKREIEDYFDRNFELEYYLQRKKKIKLRKQIKSISHLAKFVYLRQPEPAGAGDAILLAKHLIGNEPCAILFGDDIINNQPNCLQQLLAVYQQYHSSVIAVQRVAKKEISRYGIIKGKKIKSNLYQLSQIIEKPSIKRAPSNLGVVGRYIITPLVIELLAKFKSQQQDEFGFTNALQETITRQSVYACQFAGERFDCGSKLGWLMANCYFALQCSELKQSFKQYLKKIL